LHRREFSALKQPSDEMAVNETVEAVGFDFIQPPVVEFEINEGKEVVLIKIKKFESRARLKGEEQFLKYDALSMVMVDYNYNGNVFDLDKVFYADELKSDSWKIKLPVEDIKGDIMLLFLDIYGNESFQIIKKKHSVKKTRSIKKK
jgi:site-specific DNA-methyltransferase (adenine-specific)/adenine-specific DNA-methyltransferase